MVDLSDKGIFGKAAAVYPIVFEVDRGATEGYEVQEMNGAGALLLPAEVLRERLNTMMPLPPSSPAGRSLLQRLLTDPRMAPLRDHFEVRWAISFHRSGLRDQFTSDQEPKGAVMPRRFLGGGRFAGNREVEPYRIDWRGHWIDYDEDRARAEKNPFPGVEIFDQPKVVVCQNARRGRAALDRSGLVLKDTFLCVRPQPGRPSRAGELAWLVLVVNSDLFHYVYEHLYGGTRKGGRYLHYLGSYMAPFPLPIPEDLSEAVRLHDRLVADSRNPKLRRQAERLVQEAYGIEEAERVVLDAYAYPEALS